MRALTKRLLYAASILLGVAGFAAIPFIVGFEDLRTTIARVGWPCLAVYTANASLSLLIPAVSWWVLMRGEGIRATLGAAIRANLMGFPLNFITPSMYLGGEPLKTVYISRVCSVSKRRVLATIIVAKFQELAALVLGIVVATALFVGHTDYFTRRNEVLLIVLIAILTLMLGLLLAAFVGRFKPTVRILDLLASMGVARRRMARLREMADEMEGLIHAAFTKRVPTFLLAQGIALFSAASIFIRPWIFFRFLPEVPMRFTDLCMIFVVTNLVNCVTIIPGGLGLFEGAMTAYFSAAEIGDARGAAFAIVNRISDLTLIVLGIWWIAHVGLTAVARGREPALAPEDRAGLPVPEMLLKPRSQASSSAREDPGEGRPVE